MRHEVCKLIEAIGGSKDPRLESFRRPAEPDGVEGGARKYRPGDKVFITVEVDGAAWDRAWSQEKPRVSDV